MFYRFFEHTLNPTFNCRLNLESDINRFIRGHRTFWGKLYVKLKISGLV